ncbi:MAG: sigma-70 family RNA polymerase sigma factor [Myxococcaceae bacterium]|nr:sigma-70 family RNA polymerase sigma factor [Myxococcaceae bacterium]
MDSADQSRRAIEAVWRIEAPRILGALVRWTKDLSTAEELAQEALLAALERWPQTGVPENPGAWLMTAAKHRATDRARQRALHDGKAHVLAAQDERDARQAHGLDEGVADDVLRLMLATCHPVLSVEARVALTLRLVSGLTTEEIARAYLTPAPTLAQRLVRAKRTLAEAKVPFEVPLGAALEERLDAVLEVLYLVFNEGYAATAGEAYLRPALCEEALRLARSLQALAPASSEVHGLAALLELQASRLRTRQDASGAPVRLNDQDRARWDQLLIGRGLAALERAESLARPLGPYTLQAAIAACHARATRPEDTDWKRIAALYDALAEVTQSPVVELNRAVAVAKAYGPEEGLALVDALVAEGVLRDYHLLPSVRAELLASLGRSDEARAEFERAAALAHNTREKELLLALARAQGAARSVTR